MLILVSHCFPAQMFRFRSVGKKSRVYALSIISPAAQNSKISLAFKMSLAFKHLPTISNSYIYFNSNFRGPEHASPTACESTFGNAWHWKNALKCTEKNVESSPSLHNSSGS